MIDQHKKEMLEPELRDGYVKKAKKITKQKTVSIGDFAKRYGLK